VSREPATIEQAGLADDQRAGADRDDYWPQEKIARESGFQSVDAFQRAFGRQMGATPDVYRSKRGLLS
jgi:AraC-like DNA-binding protein